MNASTLTLSALSGCVWGVIGAYLVSDGRMGARVWGGLVASPLIGIAAGMAAARFRDVGLIGRIFIPLVSLYAATALFAFTDGAWAAASGVVPVGQLEQHQSPLGLIAGWVFSVLAVLTISGYVFILWPLAVINHVVLWRWIDRGRTSSPFRLLAVFTVCLVVGQAQFMHAGAQRLATSFSAPTISPDRTTVAAQAMFPNCCTSYDIPLQLMVYASGKVHRFTGIGLPIFEWGFAKGGTQIAFGQTTVHFGCETHYELRDIASERQVDSADIPDPCGQRPDPKPVRIPTWVAAIRSRKG